MTPRRCNTSLRQSQTKTRLLLVPHQYGRYASNNILSFDHAAPPGTACDLNDLNEHFRIGESCHRPIRSARQLLREVQAAIADKESTLAAGRPSMTPRGLRVILLSPGHSSCFKHHQLFKLGHHPVEIVMHGYIRTCVACG